MALNPWNPLQEAFDRYRNEGIDFNKATEKSEPCETGKVWVEKNLVRKVDGLEVEYGMLEFWVRLTRWEKGKEFRYIASVEFPTHTAAEVKLPEDNFRVAYNEVVDKISRGDYQPSVTSEGLVIINFD